MENLKPEEQPNIEDIKGTGLGGYEKPPEPKKEEPKKWTPEEEQEIRKRAYEVFAKRMSGEAPYEHEKINKLQEENGITPWTPEAEKFMREWDWHEAEKEYARRKETGKGEGGEELKAEAKEGLKAKAKKELDETVKAVDEIKKGAPATEVAEGTTEIPPEVTALPEQVLASEEAIKKEIKKLPEEVRQRIGFSLGNIGYWIERGKGESMAWAVKKAMGGEPDPTKRNLTHRFLSSIHEKFARDAEAADKKMEDIEKGRKRTLGNVGYVGKNVYNVARPIADVIGWTAMLPLRYVSIIAAGGAVTADMLKEARLKNTKTIEKTRLHDIEEAQVEAIRVYEKAGGTYNFEKGGSGVGAEALKKAYLEDIPDTIKDRLRKNPEAGVISTLTQGIFKRHIEKSVNNLNKKIAKIEGRADWTPQKKSYEKERVFNNYRKRLNDFDRMLGQAGAVDTLAMLGKYGDLAGKAAVAATAALMLKPAFDKFWDWLAGGTADHGADIVGEAGPNWEVLGIDLKNGLDENEAKKILKYMLERTETKDNATVQEMMDRYGNLKITGLNETFREWIDKISHGGETPKTTIPWEDLIDNKGIIGHDSIWQSTKHIVEAHAKEMGYTGDLNDTAALDKWAETQTANLVNTLAESQGGEVKDLVHGGPDIGEYDRVMVHKVGGKWVLDFKAESGIEPGYLPEKPKVPEGIVGNRQDFTPFEQTPYTSPAEVPPAAISAEPIKSDLEKAFEAISDRGERSAFVYNHVLNINNANGLDLEKGRMEAFARIFNGNITDIDTADELRRTIAEFNRIVDHNKDVLIKGDLPVGKDMTYPMENANGQFYDVQRPSKDVYHVIKRLPDGRSQEIGNGWLNKKDWRLKAVKKFFGY